MNSIFSPNKSNFECSTPILKTKTNILTERNHDDQYFTKKISRYSHDFTQDLQDISFLSPSASSRQLSRTPSIENVRRLNKSDSLNNAQNSFLNNKYCKKMDVNIFDECEESEWNTTSSSIIENDDTFNDLMNTEILNLEKEELCLRPVEILKEGRDYYSSTSDMDVDLDLETYTTSTLSDAFKNNIQISKVQNWTNNLASLSDHSFISQTENDDVEVNDRSSKKEEIFRKLRLRHSKIIINDDNETTEVTKVIKNKGYHLESVTYTDNDENESNNQRNMSGQSSIINRIENERITKLFGEIKAIEEYLEINDVSKEMYERLLTKVRNIEGEINRIDKRRMNDEFWNEDEECSSDEEYGSLNDKIVMYNEMKRLMEENDVLKEVLRINQITNELAESDKRLFINELRENDRILRKYLQKEKAAVNDNHILRDDKNRLNKIIVDNSEIVAYFFQKYFLKKTFYDE